MVLIQFHGMEKMSSAEHLQMAYTFIKLLQKIITTKFHILEDAQFLNKKFNV